MIASACGRLRLDLQKVFARRYFGQDDLIARVALGPGFSAIHAMVVADVAPEGVVAPAVAFDQFHIEIKPVIV